MGSGAFAPLVGGGCFFCICVPNGNSSAQLVKRGACARECCSRGASRSRESRIGRPIWCSCEGGVCSGARRGRCAERSAVLRASRSICSLWLGSVCLCALGNERCTRFQPCLF